MGVILNNLIPIIGSSIAMSIPLVLASVGGAFSVRSGIMALGLESMMMMGAFFGVLGSYFTGSVLFGFLLGMVGGMVIGLFHGILSVRYKVNQVISGIGLNLLALAVTTLLMQLIWNNKGSTPQVASISTTLDFFAPIPVIGPILAQQSVSFLVMVAVVIVGWIVLFKTRFGLRLRIPVPGSVGYVRAQHDRRPRLHRGGHRHPGPLQSRPDRALRPAVRLL